MRLKNKVYVISLAMLLGCNQKQPENSRPDVQNIYTEKVYNSPNTPSSDVNNVYDVNKDNEIYITCDYTNNIVSYKISEDQDNKYYISTFIRSENAYSPHNMMWTTMNQKDFVYRPWGFMDSDFVKVEVIKSFIRITFHDKSNLPLDQYSINRATGVMQMRRNVGYGINAYDIAQCQKAENQISSVNQF